MLPSKILVIGHRGCGAGDMENTVSSFLRAIELGADGVELDVRSTADGAIVVHHDPIVSGYGPIHQLCFEELPAYIPTFEDALRVCAGVLVDVEVKNSPREIGFDPTEKTARRVGEILSDFARTSELAGVQISSFSSASLDAASAVGAFATGLLVGRRANFISGLRLAVARKYSAVHLWRQLIRDRTVSIAHEAGIEVWAWTVDTARATARGRASGVDGMITDRISLVRSALADLDARYASHGGFE